MTKYYQKFTHKWFENRQKLSLGERLCWIGIILIICFALACGFYQLCIADRQFQRQYNQFQN